jgi:protein tyrosine phosphatase (PTP) superfamily phosphohydrolase (DUF442 family)
VPNRKWTIVVGAAGLVAAAIAVALVVQAHRHPGDVFAVVKGGVLYRCGEEPTEVMRGHVVDCHIRTVVSLHAEPTDSPAGAAEREWCATQGVQRVDIPMSTEPQAVDGVKRFLAVVTDPACQPVLAHCENGRNRTGFAVAAYRIAADGWSYPAALAEAESFGFVPHFKHAPGYDRILRQLAAGADWRTLGNPTDNGSAEQGP